MNVTNHSIHVSLNGQALFRTDWLPDDESFKLACEQIAAHFPRSEGFTVTRVDAEIVHVLHDVTK